ncbi:UrcA family protein [Parablastomonas sp. CN1-191]|uniref:UrcA family protein n=1 Tax=Parablastomonas sp. CN1-191 TaxID=3400908 RepID=UPI003BF900D2
MKACSSLAAAAMLLASTVPALASESNVATLRYDDLDLSSGAGKAALDRRIDQAARQVCATMMTTGTVAGENAMRLRCESDARAQARAQLNRRSD